MRFTKDNTIGFNYQELDVLNSVYEERLAELVASDNTEELEKLQDQVASIILEEFTI